MNTKLTILIAGFLAAFTPIGASLSAKDKVNYELQYDDPLAFKRLFVNINLLRLDLASPTQWRPGLGAEFTLNRRLYFFGEYDHTLLPLSTVHATKNSQSYAEVGGMFSFVSTVKESNARIRSKSGGYNYRWKLKAQAHKQLGVRAGFNSFSTYKQDGDYYAYSNTNSLFAGIATTTTRDLIVNIPDRGSFDRSSRGMWYADLLIAPSITYTDATDYAAYEGSASTAKPATFPAFTKVPIGARIGFMKYKNWPLPLREGFEFGLRPGIGSGLYFAFKVDVSLGFMHGKPATGTGKK